MIVKYVVKDELSPNSVRAVLTRENGMNHEKFMSQPGWRKELEIPAINEGYEVISINAIVHDVTDGKNILGANIVVHVREKEKLNIRKRSVNAPRPIIDKNFRTMAHNRRTK